MYKRQEEAARRARELAALHERAAEVARQQEQEALHANLAASAEGTTPDILEAAGGAHGSAALHEAVASVSSTGATGSGGGALPAPVPIGPDDLLQFISHMSPSEGYDALAWAMAFAHHGQPLEHQGGLYSVTHEVVTEAIRRFQEANPHTENRIAAFREQIGGVVGSTVSAAGTGLRLGGRLTLQGCLLYTSPSPRDMRRSRMPSSA